MAKRTRRFTTPLIPPSPDPTIKARVRQAMHDTDAKLRKILADQITPETKQAITEISEQLKAQSDDPSAPAAPASAPTPPVTASAPETPRRAGQGPQLTPALRLLREEYPPNGNPPPGTTYKAAWDRVVARTPEGEKPPSRDVVSEAIKLIRGHQRRRR
jgi:hypothetical protein